MHGEPRGALEVLKTPTAQAMLAIRNTIPLFEQNAGSRLESRYEKVRELLTTAHLRRRQMPVINDQDYTRMKTFLGHSVRTRQVYRQPLHLKPLQSQIYLSKVLEFHKAHGFVVATEPILVSGDDHIIDGHHRWLDAVLLGEHIPAFEIGLTAEALFLMSIGLSDVEKHARNA